MVEALGGRRLGRRTVATAGVLLALVTCGEVNALTAGAAEQPPAVATVAVDRGAVLTRVGTVGTVEPAQTRSLAFDVSGTVTGIEVRAGEVVPAGQTLATVDRTGAARVVADAQAALDAAERQLTEARQSPQSTAGTARSGSSAGCVPAVAPAGRSPSALPIPGPSRTAHPSPAVTPSASPTAVTPSVGPSAGSPSVGPSAGSPSVDPWAGSPSVGASAGSPSVGASAGSPSVDPTPTLAPIVSLTPALTRRIGPVPATSVDPPPVPGVSPAPTVPAAGSARAGTSPARGGNSGTPGGCATGSGGTRSGSVASSIASTGATASGGARSGGTAAGGGSDPILSAQQRVIAATTTLANAEDTLDGTTITAPIAGTVLRVGGVVGSQVGAGSTFITLADTYHMGVDARFPEADADRLAVGQPAVVSLAAQADRTFRATVVQVDPTGTSDGTMVRYGVRLSFADPPGNLLVGQSATVSVTTGSKADVLRVPSSAVHGVSGPTGTVLAGGARRAVGVGLRGDQYTEITGGLSEGDRIARSW